MWLDFVCYGAVILHASLLVPWLVDRILGSVRKEP